MAAEVEEMLTEKIGNAFNTGAVPIYQGDDDTVNGFFNPESFINVSNFGSVEAAVTHAVEVWKNPHKFKTYLDKPILVNSSMDDYLALHRNEY